LLFRQASKSVTISSPERPAFALQFNGHVALPTRSGDVPAHLRFVSGTRQELVRCQLSSQKSRPHWVTSFRQSLSTMFCDGNRGSIPCRCLAGPARLLLWDSAGPAHPKTEVRCSQRYVSKFRAVSKKGALNRRTKCTTWSAGIPPAQCCDLRFKQENATRENQSSPLSKCALTESGSTFYEHSHIPRQAAKSTSVTSPLLFRPEYSSRAMMWKVFEIDAQNA
jgi:hypothetical protein